DVSCPGLCDGEVYTSATGGFGTISFDLDNGSQSAFGSGDFFNLCPGSHAVTMTDQGLCVYVVSFNVIGPPQIIFTNSSTNVSCFGGSNGTITIDPPIGGTPPF
ncbi:MAG TPA: SprB repeat-containing protein, partial [Flavobacteriales bacterium]|nr:SprB repeat-containing protein [Flavobacteriales bacterium]